MPKHCVEDQIVAGQVHCFQGTHSRPATNQIYLVTIAGMPLAKRVSTVIDTFLAMS